MTLRWNSLIAALVITALSSVLFGPSIPLAGEHGVQPQAVAPGDSADDGGSYATEPGGDEESAPDAKAQGSEPPKDAKSDAKESKDEAATSEKTPTAAEKDATTAPASEAEPVKAEETEAKPEEKPAKAEETEAKPEEEPAKEETEAKPEEEPAKEETEAKPEEEPAKEETEAKPEEEPAKEETEAKPEEEALPLKDRKTTKSGLPVPKDPIERAAFFSFEVNCARCHQAGPLLKKRKVEKNFGNVMELAKLANTSNLVVPGNPESSRLFKVIFNEEMPYDCFSEFDCKHTPTKEEIQAIYDWIKAVGDPQCPDRKLIDDAVIVEAIAADLDKQPDHRRKGMRYITLANLHNGCVSDDEMKLYRQAVVKLLNSLSRHSDVLKLNTVDDAGTIIAFNLDDLKWTPEDWDKIVSVYPYAMRPDTTPYETVKSVTGTPLAWIRGDWFAFTASRPPLYYDLLKLPKTFAELEKLENVDVKKNIEKFLVKRAGFQQSGVSKHNRLIERHTIDTGYFWTSYDFKGDSPEQSLFRHPLGPDGKDAFKHDGGETIFSLPNGFQGYYLNTAKGDRLDKGPTEIVLDPSQRDQAVTNAISCFGCHKQGINRNTDEVRERVINNRAFSRDVRKAVEALYPPAEELADILDEDTKQFQNAMKAAGLSPELDTEGDLESINALSRRYEGDVRKYMAAAEFGLEREDFEARLNDVGGKFVADKNQLKQGHLPRFQFEPEFKEWIALVSDNIPVEIDKTKVAPVEVAKVADTTELTLVADRSDYKVGDKPVFTITTKKDCNLTLIDVDSSGEGVVILPNKFEQENFVAAGKTVKFPAEDAKFDFRLADPGTETVIAVCNASGKDVDGIKHDFKKRAFTPVGNYREFLTRRIEVAGREKVAKAEKAKEEGDAGKVAAIAKTEGPSRTSVKLEVK